MTDVLGYLNAKGIPTKPADARNIHTTCVFCKEPPDARGRLYICTDPDAEVPGLYKCFLCDATGNLTTLKRHFGDAINDRDVDNETRAGILYAATDYYQAQLDANPDIVKYLTGPDRGLTADTIRDRRLGYAPMGFTYDLATGDATVARPRFLYGHLKDLGFTPRDILATGICQEANDRIVDALYGMVIIPYLVAGTPVALRGRTWPHTPDDFEHTDMPAYKPPPGKYKTCGGTTARLYNTDASWANDELIITEGEFDAMVLDQHGYAAVAVPGATTWQDSWDGYLERTKRIWVLFDRDATGEKAANKLITRFGVKARALHLSEPGTKCDPTQWFTRDNHTAADFEAVLNQARRGDLLVTVREAIDQFSAVQNKPGLKFGWELFDIMIEPGIQPAQVMILLAKTGTGKTLLLLNLMQRMRMVTEQRDLKVLFISLEQTRGEWWDRARRMHRFYNLDSTEEEAAQFWENNLLLVDRNRLSEAEVRRLLDDYAYQMGRTPDVICLDYLGYWARSFRGEPYQRTSDAVMAIKAIGKDYDCPFIIPHQVSRIGVDGQEFGAEAARDSGVIEETADFLLTMWTPDNQLGREEEEKTGQIHLRIGKSRHGGRGQLLSMQFAPLSLVMVPEGDPLCGQARKEVIWKRQRDTWEQAVYRHRTGFEGDVVDGPLARRGFLG